MADALADTDEKKSLHQARAELFQEELLERKRVRLAREQEGSSRPPVPPMAEGWVAFSHPQTGKVYYHNSSSNVTQWTYPSSVPPPPAEE